MDPFIDFSILYLDLFSEFDYMNLQDVRKILVLSLPPSSETLSMIIDCTLDVNESVRKAAYCVLASKFPLQSLRLAEHIAFTLCFRFYNCCAAVMH